MVGYQLNRGNVGDRLLAGSLGLKLSGAESSKKSTKNELKEMRQAYNEMADEFGFPKHSRWDSVGVYSLPLACVCPPIGLALYVGSKIGKALSSGLKSKKKIQHKFPVYLAGVNSYMPKWAVKAKA